MGKGSGTFDDPVFLDGDEDNEIAVADNEMPTLECMAQCVYGCPLVENGNITALGCCHFLCSVECVNKLKAESTEKMNQIGYRSDGLICPVCHFSSSPEDLPSPKQITEWLFNKNPKVYKLVCEHCISEEVATAYCEDCDNFLCAVCVEQHPTFKKTTSHKNVTLFADIPKEKLEELQWDRLITCRLHHKPMYFCLDDDCWKRICPDCDPIHINHSILNIEDERKDFVGSLEQAKLFSKTCVRVAKQLFDKRNGLPKQWKKIEDEIIETYNNLAKQAEQARLQMLKEAKEKLKKQITMLRIKEKLAELAKNRAERFVEFGTLVRQEGDDVSKINFMKVFAEGVEWVKEMNEKSGEDYSSFIEKGYQFGLDCPGTEAITSFLKNFGRLQCTGEKSELARAVEKALEEVRLANQNKDPNDKGADDENGDKSKEGSASESTAASEKEPPPRPPKPGCSRYLPPDPIFSCPETAEKFLDELQNSQEAASSDDDTPQVATTQSSKRKSPEGCEDENGITNSASPPKAKATRRTKKQTKQSSSPDKHHPLHRDDFPETPFESFDILDDPLEDSKLAQDSQSGEDIQLVEDIQSVEDLQSDVDPQVDEEPQLDDQTNSSDFTFDDPCQICNFNGSNRNMSSCWDCHKTYHHLCHIPPIVHSPLRTDTAFRCNYCTIVEEISKILAIIRQSRNITKKCEYRVACIFLMECYKITEMRLMRMVFPDGYHELFRRVPYHLRFIRDQVLRQGQDKFMGIEKFLGYFRQMFIQAFVYYNRPRNLKSLCPVFTKCFQMFLELVRDYYGKDHLNTFFGDLEFSFT